jgi:hypothetical protein
MQLRPLFGRYGAESGHHRLVTSISAFDPNRKSSAGAAGGSSKRQLPSRRAKQDALAKLDEIGFDRSLVPFQSCSRHVGYMQKPVLELVGPLENWIGPVLPL